MNTHPIFGQMINGMMEAQQTLAMSSPGMEPPRPMGCPNCAQAEAEVDRLNAAIEALNRIEEEMLAHCHTVNQAEGRTPDEIMRIPKAWQPIGVILHKWRTGKIMEPGDHFRSEYSRLVHNLTIGKGGMADTLQAARKEVDRLKAALDLEAKARVAAAEMAQEAKLAQAQAEGDANAMLMLLAQIREAVGDNGRRMQNELIDYLRILWEEADPDRVSQREAELRAQDYATPHNPSDAGAWGEDRFEAAS